MLAAYRGFLQLVTAEEESACVQPMVRVSASNDGDKGFLQLVTAEREAATVRLMAILSA
jgi:hypothetical protein